MISQGEPLTNVPNLDLLSILFAENNFKDTSVAWRNGQNEQQNLTRGSARKLVRRLANGYIDAGLINPTHSERDVFIVISENQIIGFPNILAVIAAGGIVATCPSQATAPELLFRIKILHPKAIICSTKSLPLVVSALKVSPTPFEIVIQDSESMTVRNRRGISYISEREHAWSTTWNDEVGDRPALLVFSSGTTGTPKGTMHSNRYQYLY